MASLNVKSKTKAHTHEGAPSVTVKPLEQLRRTVMTCMLWENNFYEGGASTADRVIDLVSKVTPQEAFQVAVDARTKMNLRHVPLLIARTMAKLPAHKKLVANLLPLIILRPDELTEFVKIYWTPKRQPLSGQVKKGLAKAFTKFNEYQLAKYNRDAEVKLRDVLFLCHPKPNDKEQQAVWDKLVKGELQTPDTWEVEISAKGNNKESWDRLLAEKKLGGFALIRNLRNMTQAKVSELMLRGALATMKTDRILPYRFIAAARYAVDYEPELEAAMFKSIEGREKLPGKTVLLIDVSGSMRNAISGKSELLRQDAACGVAMIARELCDSVEVYTFSERLVKVPPRRGFALRDVIDKSQQHSGTDLGGAVKSIIKDVQYDRIIVISDEQSNSPVPNAGGKDKSYIINVATYENGVGYDSGWTHINGWSEAVLDYIREVEKPITEPTSSLEGW